MAVAACVALAVPASATSAPSGGSTPPRVGGTGIIAGTMWYDRNGDGYRDGDDTTRNRVHLYLTPAGQPTVVLQSVYSNAAGQYNIANVPAGVALTVRFAPAPGFEPTLGGRQSVYVGGGYRGSVFFDFSLTTNQVLVADAGVTKPASLGDRVWVDTNHDGIQEPGEPGLAGVIVFGLKDGSVFTNAVTDSAGHYHFDGFYPGTGYRVEFGLPVGYRMSPRHAPGSTTANDSNPDSSGLTGTMTIGPGASVTSVDAGMYPASAG